MAPSYTSNQRKQLLLLLDRLLSAHQAASPFTLLLDSLEQSSKPLIREYVRRANASKTTVIFVSYQTLHAPPGTTHFVRAHKRPFADVQTEIATLTPSDRSTLLILDTLHPLIHQSLAAAPPVALPALLAPLLAPRTALLATLHAAVPLPPAPPYQPAPRALLAHAATTLITVSPLVHARAAAAAARRALPPPPARGLDEGVPGVLVGRGAQTGDMVLTVEHRRRSGRAVAARFVMGRVGVGEVPGVKLLEECAAYRRAVDGDESESGNSTEGKEGKGEWTSTFELGLTEKQRRDREGVVLPYFDAQRGYEGEPGQGGRILYQMGSEDMGDWDDEEDEI